ncbi:MAG: hypothetical protein U5L11_02550 [Arhodomonas sp.]|nr:hypothetical protein [Arhodomonas sp.]
MTHNVDIYAEYDAAQYRPGTPYQIVYVPAGRPYHPTRPAARSQVIAEDIPQHIAHSLRHYHYRLSLEHLRDLYRPHTAHPTNPPLL